MLPTTASSCVVRVALCVAVLAVAVAAGCEGGCVQRDQKWVASHPSNDGGLVLLGAALYGAGTAGNMVGR
jgi:hypothetical protein